MTLEELGALLGERREALGLSKADVAERLKYTESRIGDVERGDLSSMPHKAYAKGFLRTYARMLGLSPDEGESATALTTGSADEPGASPGTQEPADCLSTSPLSKVQEFSSCSERSTSV